MNIEIESDDQMEIDSVDNNVVDNNAAVEDVVHEGWALEKVYTIEEITSHSPIKCDGSCDDLIACSLWRDVRTRVEFNCCLDCQAKNDETGFGGWPKQLEDIPLAPQGFMAAEHRMCIATHCSIDHTWNKGIRFGSLTFPPRENSRRRTNMNT